MITINLLPEEKKSAKKRQITVNQDLLVTGAQAIAIVLCVIVLAVNLYLQRELSQTQKEKSSIVAQRDRLKPGLDELEVVLAELAKIDAKQAIIADLKNNRIQWAQKMFHLSENLDPDVWLEQIEITHNVGGKGTQQDMIVLSMVTPHVKQGNLIMSRTMRTLENSEFIDRLAQAEFREARVEPWLSGSAGLYNTDVWRFQVVFRIPTIDPPAPPAPRGGQSAKGSKR